MNRVLIVCGIVCCSLWLQAQTITIRGTVYNSADSSVVSKVYVGTKQSFDGAIADSFGRFKINVNYSDTLYFSSLEFDKQYLPVRWVTNPDDASFYLNPTVYNINQVVITAFSKKQFREDFMNLELPPDPFAINLKMPEDLIPSGIPSKQTPTVSIVPFGLSLTFGRCQYLKQVLEANEHIALWQNTENRHAIAKSKYTPQIIQLLVPLTDDQMEAFMKFCDLKEEFILQATEYEIGTAIKECYLAFIDENMQH